MTNFESGVASFVKGYAVVEVNFPVDDKGRADISCFQCPFFYRNSNRCQLNDKMVAYPQRYVGQECPLEIEEEQI